MNCDILLYGSTLSFGVIVPLRLIIKRGLSDPHDVDPEDPYRIEQSQQKVLTIVTVILFLIGIALTLLAMTGNPIHQL
ncbi:MULTISPECIES: hypothetical protein [Halorubrum]|uniref:hypothetical protein n=1 Tax=Halorubrum TaxID=56688 RepID=UPI0010F71DAB|nr:MULTISPECIES: hypothetical protein [Halorubrum]TKX64151.1 hypothetical protein EXE47_12260 [Halorubrum sp. GN12_10-3_MGM]